jgi:hypothetical protein
MSDASQAAVGINVGGPTAPAGFRAPAAHRVRRAAIANVALVLLFASTLIDGFPPGAAVLREFGARPANFLLVIAWLVLLVRRLMRGAGVGLKTHEAYLLVAIFVGAPLLNIPVALAQSSVGARLAMIDWVKQFLMLGWGLTSYLIWKRIVTGIDTGRYCALISISVVVPVLAFLLEYFDSSGTVKSFLQFFRIGHNPRASSFATEPSLYGAWIAFVWPLVLFYSMRGGRALRRFAARVLLAVALITALMSGARTFAVVLMLQLLYVCYWAIQRQRGWGSRIRLLLLALCITLGAAAVLAGKLMSTTDLTSNESDITRVGDTVTGINVALAHPLVGVGIGEFGNFFAQYAPSFALRSIEVDQLIAGQAQYRASTFNMFVRLCVEFGIPLGIAFTIFILRPVVKAPKWSTGEPFVPYAAVSAVGGAGFWLSQDTYGYQPAILALAVLALLLTGVMRTSTRSAIAVSGKD